MACESSSRNLWKVCCCRSYLEVLRRGDFRGEADVGVSEIGADNVTDLSSQFVYLFHGLRCVKREQSTGWWVYAYLWSHEMLRTK